MILQNFFVLILLIVFGSVYAQDKKDCCTSECESSTKNCCKIVFDLTKNCNLTLPTKLKKGDCFVVEIKNINLNLYNVTINSQDQNKSTAVELPLPGTSTLNFDNLNKLTSNFNTTISSTKKDSIKKSDKELASLKFIKIKTFENTDKPCDDSKAKLDQLSQKIKQLYTIYDNKKTDLYIHRLKKLSISNDQDEYNCYEELENIKTIRNDLNELNLSLNQIMIEYEICINTLSKEAKENATFKEYDKNFKAISAELVKLSEEFRKQISAEEVEKLLSSIINLTSNTTFVSTPLQFTKEQTKLTVEITPKAANSTLQKYTYGPYIFPTDYENYWTVGTSLYYGFGFKNERYSSIGTTTAGVTTYTLVEEPQESGELGIAALLRCGKKFSNLNLIGYHFTLGTGLSIEKNPRPRLLGGIGLSFGNTHNITIDIGALAGYVDVKSNAVNTSDLFTEKPTNLTVTKLKFGGFLSVGYMYKLN